MTPDSLRRRGRLAAPHRSLIQDRPGWPRPDVVSAWLVEVGRLTTADLVLLGLPTTSTDPEQAVTQHALELLIAKCPALYDALPWHDWDFSLVERDYQLYRNRFLFAGSGAGIACCRARRSRGVYVVEANPVLASYTERKAELERVRRFTLIRSTLEQLSLPELSVDLACIGGSTVLGSFAGGVPPALGVLERIARRILLIDNDPLAERFPSQLLEERGFQKSTVAVRSLGQRDCWWGPRRPS